eukprot:CAMPEP_0180539544 /NCGR_PEP_ID=MMETSP1036_2-20121128/66958_1 /TAXON_ID=632150 /ORGANISM="Azadinium spinosum, Strain 3D9" /LENGTH=40 /DNA_ID= /DNA_START= /DNA_END= /DNA_ORIENTATION=
MSSPNCCTCCVSSSNDGRTWVWLCSEKKRAKATVTSFAVA